MSQLLFRCHSEARLSTARRGEESYGVIPTKDKILHSVQNDFKRTFSTVSICDNSCVKHRAPYNPIGSSGFTVFIRGLILCFKWFQYFYFCDFVFSSDFIGAGGVVGIVRITLLFPKISLLTP